MTASYRYTEHRTITINISMAQIYMWVWSNALNLHQVLRLPNYLAQTILSLQELLYYFLIPTHPVNYPCGRKPEHPEKTHDFRQSVDVHMRP